MTGVRATTEKVSPLGQALFTTRASYHSFRVGNAVMQACATSATVDLSIVLYLPRIAVLVALSLVLSSRVALLLSLLVTWEPALKACSQQSCQS